MYNTTNEIVSLKRGGCGVGWKANDGATDEATNKAPPAPLDRAVRGERVDFGGGGRIHRRL